MLGVTRVSAQIAAFLKISLLIVVALYAPQLCIYISRLSFTKLHKNVADIPVVTGLEKIDATLVQNFIGTEQKIGKIALFTNQTDKEINKKKIDFLRSKGISINAVITTAVGSTINKEKEYDIFLIDMPLNGTRDSCITLFQVLSKASELNKKVIVLDRPNPLGNKMEDVGCLIKHDVESVAQVPLRHGMTIGELAQYFNKNGIKKPLSLMVVPMENYHRQLIVGSSEHISDESKIFRSSNFLKLMGKIYPFTVGLQSQQMSEYLALPNTLNIGKQKWYYVRELLKKRGIETTFFRHFNKQKKEFYSGLTLSKSESGGMTMSAAVLDIIEFFKKEQLMMKLSKNFGNLIDSQLLRSFIEGKITREKINKEINQQLDLFFHKAGNSFIYSPLPKISYI